MNVFQSIFLGIIQGLTELLPISSSAHLNIIPWIFNWAEIPNSYDVALHFGTLLAIVIFFFNDWIKLLIGGVKQVFKKEKSTEGKMFWYLVAATIPGGILGYVCSDIIDNLLEEKQMIARGIIGASMIILGIVLYLVDKNCKSETEYKDMKFKQTFLIGISQVLAFVPGVSRSGITMTTARLMKVDRESAAKFSFLLSTPIVLGAVIFKLDNFIFDLAFVLGVLSSFIVGIIVIKFLLNYLKKGSFKVFAIYRVIFALLIFILMFIK